MKYLVFFILLIFLIKESNEVEITKRIEGAVKYILSQLENKSGAFYYQPFTFKYNKYKISFTNFKLLSPIIDSITFNNKTSSNSSIFEFNNVTFGFLFDITIYFNDNINKYYKEDNYVDLALSSLYFYYDDYDEFITLHSFGDINSNLNDIKTNFDFKTLDYFKELKERKTCLCKKNNENIYKEVNSKTFFLNYLQELISSLFPAFERLNILLAYDAYMIFNSTLVKINCSGNHLDYIKINKILIRSDQISIQSNFRNKLWIDQIKYIGIYYSSLYNQEFDFFFELEDNDINKNVITLMKGKMQFNLDNINIVCKFCDNHPNVKNDLKIAIKNDYGDFLKKEVNSYYNS